MPGKVAPDRPQTPDSGAIYLTSFAADKHEIPAEYRRLESQAFRLPEPNAEKRGPQVPATGIAGLEAPLPGLCCKIIMGDCSLQNKSTEVSSQ